MAENEFNRAEVERIKSVNSKYLVQFKDGTSLPRLGQGTWYMGDHASKKQAEIRTLRLGVELGMNVIDTAEMYGNGKSESLVGEAIEGIRNRVFLVSKVYPHNAGLNHIVKSCENSLRRLKTDYLDLYLLHWRGSIPLRETIEGMNKLIESGKILRWGVSNFDASDMNELFSLDKGSSCMTNEVLYHLGSRGIEYDLLPWQREHNTPILAYSPLAQAGSLRGGLIENKVVKSIADTHGANAFQILLAWCIRTPQVLAIPKASTEAHVYENAAAGLIELTDEDLRKLDEAFPKPTAPVPLDIV